MSVKSTLVTALSGGVVVYCIVLVGLMNTESSRQLRLENRQHEASSRPYSVEDRKAAEAEYRELVADWTRLRGPDFLNTIECRATLARILEGEGKSPEAEAEYRAVVDAKVRTLGSKNSRTLDARESVASLLEQTGKYADGEVERRTVVTRWEELSGPLSRDTLRPRRLLMQILDEQEKYAEELTVLQGSFSVVEPLAREQKLRLKGGPAIMETDWQRHWDLLQATKKLVEERAAAKLAAEESRKKLGDDAPETRSLRQHFEDLKKQKVHLPKKPPSHGVEP